MLADLCRRAKDRTATRWRANEGLVYQTALKDALAKANTNLTFVRATPCGFTFP